MQQVQQQQSLPQQITSLPLQPSNLPQLEDLFTKPLPIKIWNTLQAIYLAEEASSKKFLVSNYMEFKMVDDKSITEQVQEFQLIANKIAISGIALDENFRVGAIVSKLPPSWKEYRSKLLHKKEDLTLEQLLQHSQTE
ncbi:uncharacterized protein LOC124885910 [Capsicum annuum]|uniref:uncharacterized protein LOC124885910 n=1 Tax=Capsicum annuum TaxID=4072 RepID=UPI001FB1732F|nr:uncharacterized protein LOC124885910 [Capsicum annuum]